MPGPVAPLLGFALGVAFAWASTEELSHRGSAAGTRALLVAALFGLIVFAPVTAYFLAFWSDWAFAYTIDTERLPDLAQLGLVLVNAASCPLGFAVAARPALERRSPALLRLLAVVLIPAAALVLGSFRRLAVSATYAQFHGDFGTRPIAGSALGYAVLWMLAVLTVSALWTARGLRRMSAAAARD
jgi:hypothetical protein